MIIKNIGRLINFKMKSNNIKVEICAGSAESCVTARRAGAHRVELCSALSLGGITPSFGAISLAKKESDIDINVLIRPRQGDFLYSRREIEVMMRDIEMCGQLGVSGVVFGALDKYGNVDTEFCKPLAHLARSLSLSFTFHRAIDVSKDIFEALEAIISLGADRILTSGGAQTAAEAIPVLKKMNQQAAGRVIIMPGSGVNATNIAAIIEQTGVSEIHLSASENIPSASLHRPPLSFTPEVLGGDYLHKESSLEKVKEAILIVNGERELSK